MDTPILPSSRRKKPSDYLSLAQSLGFEWIGPEVGNSHESTSWKCSKGHTFRAAYHNLAKGNQGCPECSRNQPEDYHRLAESRGYTWLGPIVRNSGTKTHWRCSEGHEWEAPYRYLKNGKGCPECGNKGRRNPGNKKHPCHYHELANSRGFKWIGEEVENTTFHTEWECSSGHRWYATYNMIQSGKGCPDCCGNFINGRLVSSQQIELAAMLGGVVNYQIGQKAADVALFVGDIGIAVEYDSWYWHGGKTKDDLDRIDGFLSAGWRVLRIKSSSKLPSVEIIREAIDRLVSGAQYEEITLDDWGKGETWHDVKARGIPKVPE